MLRKRTIGETSTATYRRTLTYLAVLIVLALAFAGVDAARGATAAPASPAAVNVLANHATPPPPAAYYSEISYGGNGDFLAACDGHGDQVVFIPYPENCYDILWTFTSAGTGTGKYLIHPYYAQSLCLTDDISSSNLYVESCPDTANQQWTHPHNTTLNLYTIYLPYTSQNVDDPGPQGHIPVYDATMGNPGGWGYYSDVFEQIT